MLKKAHKRGGMNDFQYQALRDVLKVEGDRMKEFFTIYKEVRDQTSRQKVVTTPYSTGQSTEDSHSTMFMDTECFSRRICQEVRYRRESNTRRQDSQGRSYVRQYDISQSQNNFARPQSQNCRIFKGMLTI